jgi:hypothetical protein
MHGYLIVASCFVKKSFVLTLARHFQPAASRTHYRATSLAYTPDDCNRRWVLAKAHHTPHGHVAGRCHRPPQVQVAGIACTLTVLIPPNGGKAQRACYQWWAR